MTRNLPEVPDDGHSHSSRVDHLASLEGPKHALLQTAIALGVIVIASFGLLTALVLGLAL